MPKGRSRKRKDKAPSHHSQGGDGMEEDSGSVCSSMDGYSVTSEDGLPEDQDSEEDLEFQLAEHIDRLTEKNSRTRVEALLAINKILSLKLVSQCLTGCKETLLDVILKGLKKSSGRERLCLLELSMLLTVQLGVDEPGLVTALRPVLTQLAQDPTVPAQERAECVRALGVIVFIQISDLLEVAAIMRIMDELYRKSKLELIVASAVKSWTLLLSIAPDRSIPLLYQELLPVLNNLLDKSLSINVRVAVGQAIALLFELVRDADESLLDGPESDKAYEIIQQLASESDRYTARKERNHQRSCFKDVLSTLDGGIASERVIRTGIETLSLNSWARQVQYDSFKDLLGPGVNNHLAGNELLREVFQMGPPPLIKVESKAAKLDRKFYNAVMAKQRTQSRGKLRDKRTVT